MWLQKCGQRRNVAGFGDGEGPQVVEGGRTLEAGGANGFVPGDSGKERSPTDTLILSSETLIGPAVYEGQDNKFGLLRASKYLVICHGRRWLRVDWNW